MNTKLWLRAIVLGVVVGTIAYALVVPRVTTAAQNTTAATLVKDGRLTICKLDPTQYEVVKTIKVMVTAYSSSWDETTGIPGKPGLITASGKIVADGLVAYNHLPFGTKLKINAPGLEDKIFEVADRTAAGRKNLDIWMPSKQQALEFGAKVIKIEILES